MFSRGARGATMGLRAPSRSDNGSTPRAPILSGCGSTTMGQPTTRWRRLRGKWRALVSARPHAFAVGAGAAGKGSATKVVAVIDLPGPGRSEVVAQQRRPPLGTGRDRKSVVE